MARKTKEEILERLGQSENFQRVKSIRESYSKKQSTREEYEEYRDREEKTSLLEALLPGGTTPSEWREQRKMEKELKKEAEKAAAEVAAYEQFWREKKFQTDVSGMLLSRLDKNISDADSKISKLQEEKGSLLDALKPGGVTPSEWKKNRDEKEKQIKELEYEQAKYKAVRDEKKSREMTDYLPDDVKGLLDSYNALGTANKGIDLEGMFTPADRKSHAQIGSQKLKNEQQRLRIAEELRKKGYDNFEELAEYRKYITESESTDKFTEEMGEFTEKHPILSSAANLGLLPARIISGAVGHLEAFDNKTDLKNNPKSSYYALTRANQEKREVIGENFEDGALSADVKRFLYDTADSAVESIAASAMFGSAGGVMLGLGAMNESVIDSLEKGATNTEALVNGIAAGAFEAIFESVSLGNLSALKDVPVKTVKDAIKNVGNSIVVNFSEEANTEFANLMFDYLYNGGTSQYYEAVTALIGQGYSEKEAKSKVIKDMAWQVTKAGLGGALMGSAFGAYGSAAGKVNYDNQLAEYGREIVESGEVDNIVAGAKDVQGNDKLRALAEEIVFNERQQKKAELGGKITALEEEMSGIADKKALKEKGKELRSLKKEEKNVISKKDYRNVARASELLAEQTSADADTVIKDSVVKRLEALGETGDIQLKAEAITQTVRNKKLKGSQKSALEQGKYTQRVLNELKDSSGEFSSEWAEKASADIDSLYDRRYNPKLAKTAEPTAPAENEPVVQSKPQTKEYEQKVDNVKVQLKDALLRDGQDKDVLSAAVDLCFEYGRNGGYTLQDAVGSRAISEKIAPEQRKHAYEAGVYQGLKDTANVRYKGDTVSVFVNGFKGKDNISRKSYASAFDVFYSEGAHTAKSFDEALKANSSLLSYIGNGVAQQAFEQGRKFAETKSTAPAVSRKKPVVLGGYKSKTLEEKEVDVFFESLAKKLGVNITRVQSINAKNGRRANAYVDINKGEVVSSASSDNEYQSTIHESVHIAYAYNAEKMRPVAKAVKEFFISKHSAVRFEETLRSYEQNYEGDRATAEEEFIADCIAGMFSTDEGVNSFLAWLVNESGYNEKAKQTVLERFCEWLSDILKTIKELLKGENLNSVVAEFAKEETERFKEIRQMFLEALDEVADGTAEGETKNTAEGGVRMSLSEMGFEEFNRETENNIKMRQGIIINSVSDLEEHIEKALNRKEKVNLYVGAISEDVKKKIENDIDTKIFKDKQYAFVVSYDDIIHIAEHFGENVQDIAREVVKLYDIIKNYDAVGFEITNKGVKKLIFDKSYSDYDYRTVEIASNKKATLDLVTLYVTKNNIKNRSQSVPPAAKNGSQWGSASDNNIPQNDNVVNSQNMQNGNKKFSYAGVKAKESENVKLSLDWIDFAEEKARERSLASRVTELEKIIEELRGKIQHPGVRHMVSQLGVQKVARELKKGYLSKINFHVLSDELATFYGYLANENGLSWDNVKIHLESIATKILDESKYKNPDISEYSKEILREIRSVKIKLNDEQKAEVAKRYGSYNEFRKRMMGTIVLSEEGTSLDSRWQSLSEDYPIFESDIADTNQPLKLVEVVETLRQTYEDSYGMDYDSAKDMLMAEIYEQYFEVPETKYISEEYQLKLARAKAEYGEKIREAKAELKKQNEEAYKKVKAEYGETLKGLRQEQQKEILKAKARYNLRAQNIADTRIKEKKRNNIIRNVKRLDKLLRNPGKGAPSAGTNKYGKDYVHLTNIPQEFRKAVIDFCSIFIENDAGVFSGIVKSDNVTVREKKVEQLQKIYALMQKSESYLSETVAEEMQKRIDDVAKIMAERRLSQLSIEELDKIIEVTEYLTASINSQVAVWVEGKKSTVEKEGKNAIEEFNEKGKRSYIGGKLYHIAKELGVNNYKPVYFFERVGGVLEKLFLAIQNDGQRAYARNINAAAAFMEGISKKYDYEKWQNEKELVLETKQGHKLKLTKAQAMHIWATAEREKLAGKDAMHLMQGGIVFDGEIEADTVEEKDKETGKKVNKLTKKVFKYKTEDGSAHRIHFEDVMKIDEYLTDEQKAFVNECIRYLSVDMAALGNEISMELYGIKRFNEQYYIPYNSAKNFIYRKMGENGNAMLKSKSFTKETVFGANNPLVVGDFLEVITKHIEEMSMYNAMVLPLENFNRVWNYQTIAPEDDDKTSRKSVKSALQTAFGIEYVEYIDQLLEDINGGINSDAREKALVKLTSGFKKAAVLGSASVVIQQPSAVVRAFAEIDPKYFASTTFAGRKKAWEKALKYSSTALLKDIGGFDTVSGQSTVDYLTKTEYKGKDKFIKLFTDSQYRDDVLAWGPGFMDKVTWAHIWAACEKEVKTNNRGLSGEELNIAIGKRFDEVINKTQVYDSVLTRSANMRSKSSLLQMATSFMAEPTTQANMLASAAFDIKNGERKKGVRKVSSVVLSQLFNAVLVSAIYAARDDEEDKTLIEKYLSEVTNNFLGSLNPLTLIPVYKDIVSIFEGYDVKRTDMSLIGKIADAIKALKSTTKTRGEKFSLIAGSVSDALGIPLTNLIRDGLAVRNVIRSAGSVTDTTGKGVLYAIQDDILPMHQNLKLYKPDGKDERLYYAFRDGDEKMYNRFAQQYKNGGAVKSALKGQIEESFLEGELTDEEATKQFRRLGFSENEAYYEVRKLKEPVAEEESEDSNAAFKSFSEMQNIQTEADAELEAERQQASEGKKNYSEDADYTWLRDKLKAGDKGSITQEIDLLKEKGVSEDKIYSEIRKWLKKNDSEVISRAEQSLKGNYNGYENAVKRIADKYGIDESTAASAVRSAAGSDSEAVEGTVYAYGDLHFAINKGNAQTISYISKKLFEAKLNIKLNEGETYDKAYSSVRSGIRSSIKSKWKDAYVSGNSSSMMKIRRQLWATGMYDSLNKLDETLRDWLQNR